MTLSMTNLKAQLIVRLFLQRLLASRNPTNLFGLYQIPDLNLVSYCSRISLVLFQMMPESLIRNLKLRYLIIDLKIMTFEKSGSIRTQRTTHKLILVDLVDVDKVRVHRSGFLQLTMRDLKKWKNQFTHPIVRSSLYIGLYLLAW